MEAVTKHNELCTCRHTPTWFTDDDGQAPFPECACPIISLFANHLYWTLPPSRRSDFEGIETALCGTRTHDEEEIERRLMLVFAAAQRLSGKGDKWTKRDEEDELRSSVASHRERSKFERWACGMAEAYGLELCSAGPVAAWLAIDDLNALLVTARGAK